MSKPKIISYKDIPIKDLVIGKGQVRSSDTGIELDELATSIKIMGQLQPIMVAPAEIEGKFEIILGQRRYLACKRIGKKEISSSILSEKVDETTAKIISFTENLMRRNLNTKDCIDVCTYLYKKYGSMKAVAEKSGLPYDHVRQYVKYDRLSSPLRALYDKGTIDLKTALDAHDAVGGEDGSEEKAVKLVLKMKGMAGEQKRRTAKIISANPKIKVEDAVKEAKTIISHKISLVLLENVNLALEEYAKGMEQKKEDAAAELIEEALKSGGFLADDED